MKKVTSKRIKLISLLLVVTFFILGIAVFPVSAQTKTIKWRFNIYVPPTYEMSKELVKFAEIIKKRTDGKLTLEIHYGTELGYKGPELLRALESGSLEIAQLPLAVIAAEVKWLEAIDLPFIFSKIEDKRLVLDSIRPELKSTLDDYDTFLVGAAEGVDSPSYINTFTKVPINKIEDYRGLKIRQYNPIHAKFFKKIGVAPTWMNMMEVYQAMKTGVIDGTTSAIAAVPAMKWDEVSSHATSLWVLNLFHSIGVSNKAINRLPPQLKKSIVDILREEGKKWEVRQWELIPKMAVEQKAIKYCKSKGMTVSRLPDSELAKLKAISKEIWKEWLEKTNDTGRNVYNKIIKIME